MKNLVSARLPEKILGRVEFENVGFYYNGNCEEKVLDGINLQG